MAHTHLKILELLEDTDGEGKKRIRARVQEFQPRTLFMNLKNCNADKLNQLKSLVGGSAMIPMREGMMNGQTFFQLLVDDEIIPIHLPEKIPTSGVGLVDAGSFGLKPEEKPAEPANSFAGAKLVK